MFWGAEIEIYRFAKSNVSFGYMKSPKKDSMFLDFGPLYLHHVVDTTKFCIVLCPRWLSHFKFCVPCNQFSLKICSKMITQHIFNFCIFYHLSHFWIFLFFTMFDKINKSIQNVNFAAEKRWQDLDTIYGPQIFRDLIE